MGVSDAVEPDRTAFAPGVAAALVIAGVLSAFFYVVFAAYAPDSNGEFDGRANALSRSAVGFAALVELLEAQDIPVLISRGLSKSEFDKASLVILTPSLSSPQSEIIAVTSKEPKLVILPKWSVGPDPLHPGWVNKIQAYDTDDLVEKLLKPLAQGTLTRNIVAAPEQLHNGFNNTDLATGPIESLQTVAGNNWIGYFGMGPRTNVVARLDGTQTYVLSDPDLMNTRGLHDLKTARAAIAIIQSLRANKGPVIIDVTLSGYRRSPNILRLVFEPPLLGATICALLAGFLLGLRGAVRFGAPVESGRVFAFGKQALADNSAALIAMTRREHRIVSRYAAAIRRRVARAVGITADLKEDSLDAVLERLRPRGVSGPPLSTLISEAGAAQNEEDALRVARGLYRWKGEMMHER